MTELETGIPSGHIERETLIKKVKPGNVLRVPEKSFTIDQAIYDGAREYISNICMILENTHYELTVIEFDKYRVAYDYGNGAGYRVAIKHWRKTAEQAKLFEVE